MKKQLYFLSLLVFQNCLGQNTFIKKYTFFPILTLNATFGTSVETTTDSNLIIGGCSANQVFLMKTNFLGDTLWSKSYNAGTSNNVRAHQTFDGGYILSGGNINTAISPDYGLIKTDSIGNMQWAKSYGGNDIDFIRNILQTADSGFIMVGTTESYGSGSSDIYVIKTDSYGKKLWAKTYGNIDADLGFSIIETKDSNYVLTGKVASGSFGYLYLLKINLSGDTLWTKSFFDLGGVGQSLKQTSDGGFIICGVSAFNGYLLKTDNKGDLVWAKTYGDVGYDWFYDVIETIDNGYILVGSSDNFTLDRDIFILKTDSTGVPLWANTFPDVAVTDAYSVCKFDNGYVITGAAGLTTSFGENMILIKTDSMGHSCSSTPFNMPYTNVNPYLESFSTYSSSSADTADVSLVITQSALITDICSSTGVNEIKKAQQTITIFPNPFQNFLSIKCEDISFKEITLFDIFGRKCLEKSFTNSVSINAKHLAKGIYIYQIKSEGGNSEIGKLIKQ